jgi:hypothetical protein
VILRPSSICVSSAVLVLALAACKQERPPQPAPEASAALEAPAPVPAAPTARHDVRCERVLSAALQKQHMYGWPLTESASPDRATCLFDDPPFKRVIVAFDCREGAVSAERQAKVAALGLQEISWPGRRALGGSDGIPVHFWDDDTPCEVMVDKVGWNEPKDAQFARIRAVAEALAPTSISR